MNNYMSGKIASGKMTQGKGRIIWSITDINSYAIYYMVVIILITKQSEGYDIYNTSTGIPYTQDFMIHVMDITNTTVDFEWKEPSIINGLLHHYDVEYRILDDTEWKLGSIDYNCINLKDKYCRMEQLKSYQEYVIVIYMYTTTNYKYRSKSEYFRTFPGSPDKVIRPQLSHGTSTMVIASWQPPKKPAGHSNYFEVGIVETGNNEFNNMDSKSRDSSLCITKISKIDNYYHSDSYTSHIPIPDCKNGKEQNTYFIVVRAVNKNEMLRDYPNKIPHYGPWSVAGLVLKKCILIGMMANQAYNCILSCGAMYDIPVVPTVNCTFMSQISFSNISTVNEYINKYT